MSLLGKVNIRDTVRFTENDAIPIYRQIAESLRQSILSGEFKEGCKLPSESEFAKELGINHLTLRKSLQILFSADQHNLFELSRRNILESCNLLSGTDTAAQHRTADGRIIPGKAFLFFFSVKQQFFLPPSAHPLSDKYYTFN